MYNQSYFFKVLFLSYFAANRLSIPTATNFRVKENSS